MSNIATATATATATAKFKVGERIVLPIVVSREECKKLCASLWGADSGAFADIDRTAATDTVATKVLSLALSKLVFGDSSRLERAEKYAATLPNYRKTKAGQIVGNIGKRLVLLQDAVSIGAALRDGLQDVERLQSFDLHQIITGSPVLYGMLAPAAKRTAIAKTDTSTNASTNASTDASTDASTGTDAKVMTDSEIAAGVGMLYSNMDNPIADKAYAAALSAEHEQHAKARWLAERLAEREADKMATRTGKIELFQQLAVDLGVKLTAGQLKVLNLAKAA